MQSTKKVLNVFNCLKVLALIAAILCFAGAFFCLLAAILLNVFTRDGSSAAMYFELLGTGSVEQMTAVFLSDFVLTAVDGILLLFARKYFANVIFAGTPFTKAGADEVKRLGIAVLIAPVLATAAGAVICAVFDALNMFGASCAPAIVTGVFLLIYSVVVRNGAEEIDAAKSEQL